MKFLNGSLSFVRFKPAGKRPRAFGEEFLDRLREHHCGTRNGLPADGAGVKVGWAGGTHPLDAEFALDKNVYPDHLLFDLWQETDKPPTDRLKAYYEADLKALATENPSGKPSARNKREARESARERLGREARHGWWKKWPTVPVAWDAASHEVFFGSHSAAAARRLESLWEQTFPANLFAQANLGGPLAPLTAGAFAKALHKDAGGAVLSPFHGQDIERPCWCPDGSAPDFFGNEFLLWLWWLTDTSTDTVVLPDGSEATFMFSGGVKVQDPAGQSGDGTLNSASAIRMSAARAAVRAGHLPRKAALTLVRDGYQFSFVLSAETLGVTKGRLPKSDPNVTGRGRDEGRLQHLHDLAAAIDLLYAAFLGRRLSSYWDGELREIQAWLRARVAA